MHISFQLLTTSGSTSSRRDRKFVFSVVSELRTDAVVCYPHKMYRWSLAIAGFRYVRFAFHRNWMPTGCSLFEMQIDHCKHRVSTLSDTSSINATGTKLLYTSNMKIKTPAQKERHKRSRHEGGQSKKNYLCHPLSLTSARQVCNG